MSWNRDFSTWLVKDTWKDLFVIMKIFSARKDLDPIILREVEMLQEIQRKIQENSKERSELYVDDSEEEDEDYYFVKVYNAFAEKISADSERCCLVFETYGFDCTQLYESKKILLANTKDLINQVLFTINLLHEKCGIVHGDLVPENIVFCANRRQMQRIYQEIYQKLKEQALQRLGRFQEKLRQIEGHSDSKLKDEQGFDISGFNLADEQPRNQEPQSTSQGRDNKPTTRGDLDKMLGIEDNMEFQYEKTNHAKEEQVMEELYEHKIDSESDKKEFLNLSPEERDKMILNKDDLNRKLRKWVKKRKTVTKKQKISKKKQLKEQMKRDIGQLEELKREARLERERIRLQNLKEKRESEKQWSKGDSFLPGSRNPESDSRGPRDNAGLPSDKYLGEDENSKDELDMYDNDEQEEIYDSQSGWNFKSLLLDKILSRECVQIKLINFYNSFYREEAGHPGPFKINQHTAPEVLMHKTYNYKIDIWSFGSSIFELLTHKSMLNFYQLGKLKNHEGYFQSLNSCYSYFSGIKSKEGSGQSSVQPLYFEPSGMFHYYKGKRVN